MAPRQEYRAVFEYPPSYYEKKPSRGYGPARRTPDETWKDAPFRPEESHGYRIGTQVRTVTDWEDC